MSDYTNSYYDPRLTGGMPWWGSQNVKDYGSSEFPSWGSENITGYGDSSVGGEWQQQGGGGMNYGQIGGNVAAGLGAGQAGGNPDRFNMSGGNIMGSAATGFATGGPIGAVVGGVTSFFKQDRQIKDNIENVNTSFNGMTDAYGRPVYQGREFAQGFNDLGEMMDASRPGAKAMRQKRRNQLLDKAGQLYQGIQQGQQSYNTASDSYRNRGIQMQEYFEKMNSNRLQNLHTY